MKLFSNDEAVAKPGCAQFKEAAPQVRLSCPGGSPIVNDGKSVPKDLLQLSQLVGDPNTKEHVWMNACIGAGDRSLEPKHSLFFKLFSAFKTSLGASYAMLILILNFCLALFLTAQSAYCLRGINIDDFVRPFSTMDGGALFISLVAGSCFWTTLLFRSKGAKLVCCVPSIFVLGVALFFGTSSFIGYGWGLVTSAVGIGGLIGIAKAGSLCREYLPTNFNAAKLAQSSIGMLTVPAALSAWIIYSAVSTPSHITTYDNGTNSSLAVLGFMFSYCVLAQGYAIGRASKSASKAACAFLAVCVQAPLVLGLFYTATVSTIVAMMANVDPNFASMQTNNLSAYVDIWKTAGPDRGLFMFGITAATLGLAASGGYLGAFRNTLFQSRAKI